MVTFRHIFYIFMRLQISTNQAIKVLQLHQSKCPPPTPNKKRRKKPHL